MQKPCLHKSCKNATFNNLKVSFVGWSLTRIILCFSTVQYQNVRQELLDIVIDSKAD